MQTPINLLLDLLKTHIAYCEPRTEKLDLLLKLHGEACELLKYERDVMNIVFYDGEKNQFNVNRNAHFYETANQYLNDKFKAKTETIVS